MSHESGVLPASPFRGFNSLPEVIKLAVLMYVRSAVAANVRDPLVKPRIDTFYETVRM